MRHTRLTWILFSSAIAAAGCGDDEPTTPAMDAGTVDMGPGGTLTAITIEPAAIQVETGASRELMVTGTYTSGATADIRLAASYMSSNSSVALVSAGVVAGVAEGTATITVSLDGVMATAQVTVGMGMTGGEGLPFSVDSAFFGRSAFGTGNGPPLHSADEMCPMRAGDMTGKCHRYVWDGGTTDDFTGTIWTLGDGFQNLMPVDIPRGATEVSFWAWSATGGETISFFAGLGGTEFDGAEDRVSITLTTTPTEYKIPLVNLRGYMGVYGGFGWSSDNATNPGGFTFYVDDIQWQVGETNNDGLPFAVDGAFTGRSAFGTGNGPPLHSEDAMCPMRAGGMAGNCHRFVWDGGTTDDFTGAIWTVGDGFQNLMPVDIPPGATEVSFWAWSEAGGETISFFVGLGGMEFDGAEDRVSITLTTTPTEYKIPLVNLRAYMGVYGGFGWSSDNATTPGGFTFYADDIQWQVGETNNSDLPFAVDDAFTGRSAFGTGNGPPLHSEDAMCPMRAGGMVGNCHRFVWDGGTTNDFTGAIWTLGDGFQNLMSVAIPPGATEISFWAWSEAGGETISFFAGLGGMEFDGAEDRVNITVSTTPTRYTIPLINLQGYMDVFGAFGWSTDNATNGSGFTFYVDDIKWQVGEVQTPISLPMVVDDNFPGRSAFGTGDGPPLHTEDNNCPMRAGDMTGLCHRLTWDGGTGGDFTGGFWTDGDGFVNLGTKRVQPGATEVSFWAWAEAPVAIEFGAGLANQDVGTAREIINLTTTPTRYAIPLTTLASYDRVTSPFMFAATNDRNPTGFTFYVDDVKWQAGAVTNIPLPMTVDSHFAGRSGFGPDGGPPNHTEDAMCPMRAGGMNGTCHRFIYNGALAFTGAFFTDGNGFQNLNGPFVEGGASNVSFWAWGAAGGELITVGAGIGDLTFDGAESRSNITLTTTPTQYTVPLTELAGYTNVFGAFMFAANNGDNPAGATFFVDDIQWVR